MAHEKAMQAQSGVGAAGAAAARVGWVLVLAVVLAACEAPRPEPYVAQATDVGGPETDLVWAINVGGPAYDGLDGIHFPLIERAGRKTLSAEDVLDFALDADAFEPVAIFGVKGCESEIVYGDGVRELLLASYRKQPPLEAPQTPSPG